MRIVFHPHGTVGDIVAVLGAIALAWWAILEAVSGDSPFRRVLGGVVLVAMALRVAS